MALRIGSARTIPNVAAGVMGSAVPRAQTMVRRPCVVDAASIADLARQGIRSKAPVATATRDFVKTVADGAALRRGWVAMSLVSGNAALRTGTARTIPNVAMDQAGSVVLPAGGVDHPQCATVAVNPTSSARQGSDQHPARVLEAPEPPAFTRSGWSQPGGRLVYE